MKNIVNQQIKKVLYSDVNAHNSQFYFEGFDVFDYAINVQMTNGHWWHFAWGIDEYFEFGKKQSPKSNHLQDWEIKQWVLQNVGGMF